jgi:ABC-type transporter Mla MlaB component
MMKITVVEAGGKFTLLLEGKLVAEWVGELERCWEQVQTSPERIAVDLTAVTSVDATGKTLLDKMHQAGTVLVAGPGLLTSYIVQQIRRTA